MIAHRHVRQRLERFRPAIRQQIRHVFDLERLRTFDVLGQEAHVTARGGFEHVLGHEDCALMVTDHQLQELHFGLFEWQALQLPDFRAWGHAHRFGVATHQGFGIETRNAPTPEPRLHVPDLRLLRQQNIGAERPDVFLFAAVPNDQ